MTLMRKLPRSVRFYSVALYPTLFNDFLLVHHCGKNCSPKSRRSYFDTKKEALYHSLNIISSKQQEGYILLKKPLAAR